MDNTYQCQCGKSQFTVLGAPMLRFICHCTICQKYTGRDYSDVTFFLNRDIAVTDRSQIEFKKHKMPPAVNRGRCKHCDHPFLEELNLPLVPGMTLIPTPVLEGSMALPEPRYHVFYDRCVHEIDDDLKKYSGFIPSEVALFSDILPVAYKRYFSRT